MSFYLKHLNIKHFRNLTDLNITLDPHYNLFYGENGSGKTSLLEAAYYLSLARSFRTHKTNCIIQHDKPAMHIAGELYRQKQTTHLGIQKHQNGSRQMRINQEEVQKTASLAKTLPLQLIHSYSCGLIHASPRERRAFLNWGTFHTENSFIEHWKYYQQALRQRNTAIRLKQPPQQIITWNPLLAEHGEMLHRQRQSYFSDFCPVFQSIWKAMQIEVDMDIQYHPGWQQEISLNEALEKNSQQDYYFGYTRVGPHRADLLFQINNKPAQHILSQGQQKLFIYALKLSQSYYLKQQLKKPSLLLIDDLPAELDRKKQGLLKPLITELDQQVFITGISKEDLSLFSNSIMFHVEHGQVR